MSEKITLRGIAWDHPRGYEPLKAVSKTFMESHPQVRIEWDIRSLKEFGDMPIENLIQSYDLITIDHPYMGQAHKNQLLLPLNRLISSTVLHNLEEESVGPSFQSYWYKNHLYALPIDAAALVSATREDIASKLNLRLPRSRKDLLNFYKTIPTEYSVAWPLCPTDLWCSFLTLCAQDGGRHVIQNYAVNEKAGAAVLDELKIHLGYIHPESIHWNPIQLLDEMSASDYVIYAPYLFGYTNYSRTGYAKNILTFHNSPTNSKNNISTILGGVGMAISSQCHHSELALAFVVEVAQSKTQETTYTENGGQPGNVKAWKNETNNKLCNNFFNNTLDTLRRAYVRPNHTGWNRFQEQGAELLHRGLLTNTDSNILMKDLNQLYQSVSHEKQLQ